MESQDPLHLFWRHFVFALPHSFIEEESPGENRRHCVGLGASVFRDTIPGLDILYVLYNTQCDQGKYKLSHHFPSLPHFFRPSLCIPGKEKKSKAATYQFSPYAIVSLSVLAARLIVHSLIQDSYAVFIPALMLYAAETFASWWKTKHQE